MDTFNIIAGTGNAASGYFKTSWGSDKVVIDNGLFKKQELSLSDITLSTEGQQASEPTTIRFRLRHNEQEWVCECPDSTYSKLVAMVRRNNSDTESAEDAIEESSHDARIVVVVLIIAVVIVFVISQW